MVGEDLKVQEAEQCAGTAHDGEVVDGGLAHLTAPSLVLRKATGQIVLETEQKHDAQHLNP